MESGAPQAAGFESSEIDVALSRCEALRKRQLAGDDVSFVTLASENPNSVTKAGVDVTGAEYDWKKRRS